MNLPAALITWSPFFGISEPASVTAVMWSPWIEMAAFGIIFPLPGSIAVPLRIMVRPEGVARHEAAALAAARMQKQRKRFII